MAQPDGSVGRQWRPPLLDVGIALSLAVAGQAEVLFADVSGSTVAQALTAAGVTLPLAWRGRAPVTIIVITTSALSLGTLAGVETHDSALLIFAPLLAVYSVAERGPGARVTVGALAAVAGYAAAALIGDHPSDLLLDAAGITLALVAGLAVHTLGFETDALQARAKGFERERDEATRRAIVEERARIARELHDVIGHSIAVMGVQAAAVRRVLPSELPRERSMLESVESTGRDAVTEMRRLLGLLRAEETTPVAALPTLRQVEALVAEMQDAGLDVALVIEGDLEDVSPGRALAGFRILQEALTNALKHAPGCQVQVLVRRTSNDLLIDAVDDGTSPHAPDHAGQGLIGMRERAGLYGGTVDAWPLAGGGYAVRARLPLHGAGE